ncbi:MAG: DNA mismatch repair endonuclease MutL [Clostridia bacterium]|nr:DNA mismatch repair endonuclease MutL [Clostridia bacterium]
MGKINVLDFEIANLIAAGEVVERPSSVLKELIENSIDSGATRIVAEIKRGGIAMISVTDNGCGIDKEDLPVALKRHATSKIKTKEDLDGIMTLGFRGEALAAISSVSLMTIITKTKDAEIGTMLTAEGGKVTDVSEVGTSDGTTVVVEDLFYNVPARRKFLKKDSTEAMNVTALVEKVALSRPDISIQLRIDGVEKFNTLGDGNLQNTIYAIFGKEFASKLIACDGTANGIRVHGFIGRSDNVRKNRNLENVFINGRYVKSLTAMAALEKAYTSYIAPECFPACVLFLEMNPGIVDVNVHPAKLEVKFANEQPVFEAVYYTVKRALEDSEYRPDMILGQKPRGEGNPLSAFVPIGASTKGEQISMTPPPIIRKAQSIAPVSDYSPARGVDLDKPIRVSSGVGDAFRAGSARSAEMTPKRSIDILNAYATAKAETQPAPKPVQREDKLPTVTDYKYIGEAFDCYILVEYQGELLIIDKHAAHERVIFEELKQKRDKTREVLSKPLLLPITVMLTEDELAAARDTTEELSNVGFRFNLGDKNADITEIPDEISAAEAENLFVSMLDEIILGKGNPKITEEIRRDKMLYQVACKAAIKGGRVYDRAICEWLVSRVLALPDIVVCPHGRPIAYKLTKRELDRQFDRIK